MNKSNHALEFVVFIAVIALGSFAGTWASAQLQNSGTVGSASYETPAHIATSSNIEIGPQQTKTLWATRQFCANRSISIPNGGAAARLSFDPNITPNSTTGVIAAASGTTAYAALTNGCGPVRVWAVASTTITSTEMVQ